MKINKIKILSVDDGDNVLNNFMIEICTYVHRNVKYVYYGYWDLNNCNKPMIEFQYNTNSGVVT